MNLTQLPKPEIRGYGTVIYRCAWCNETVEDPVFFDGRRALRDVQDPVLNPNDRTYHLEHLPEGMNDGR